MRSKNVWRFGAIGSVIILLVVVLSGVGSAADTSNGVTILVATNRYVILDDDRTGTAASDFSNPARDWNINYWNGERTTIRSYVLYLDSNGTPVSNQNVNFTLKDPVGTSVDTATGITDLYGLANYSFDLSTQNYYGQWQVDADDGTLTSNTSFIYNWWGCEYSGGGCTYDHGGRSLPRGSEITPNSPYINGDDYEIGDKHLYRMGSVDECVTCHRSYDGTAGAPSNDAVSVGVDSIQLGPHKGITCMNTSCHGPLSGTHSTSTTYGATIGSCYGETGCHAFRSDVSDKTTLTGTRTTGEVNYSKNGSLGYHTPTSTVPCVICHGPMHNITKPYPGAVNDVTETEQCTTCHTSLSKHNNAVGCVECHSEDIHVIQYRQDDDTFASTTTNAVDCTDCHQGSGLANFSSAPTVVKISHSQNTQNGSLWSESRTGNFWTSATEVEKCEYCHSDTKHDASAIGKPVQFNGTSDIVGGGLTGAWCGLCHYESNSNYDLMITVMGSGLVPPEITGNATYGTYTGDIASDAETGYFNHSTIGDYSDDTCAVCHDVGNDVTGISDFMHNVSYGRGGPDCISCHDVGKYAPKVNVSSINTSNNIHSGLNSGAADITGNTDNKICWGCHATDGTQPGDDHPSKYKTPYTCYECHDGTPPSHASDALAVKNHFKSGTNLTSVSGAANNSASCLECHNKAEMKSSYIEPDSENNNQSLVSHYGIKRTTGDLSNYNSSAYCVYCHNATNEFDALVTGINASITNHSNSVSGPSCANATCHNIGRIHDISLKIPTVTPTLCKSCHTAKSEHNNSVACADCHMTDNTQIHSIRFLQPDESFSTVSATAVDCTACHQGGGLANFSNATEVGMVRHSQNTLNGSLWDRGSAFWTNTSETTKCEYCHGDSKHDASALGYVNDFKGSNTVDADLTGTWCAGCHYQNNANYNTMVATLSIVPPEITGNATYGDYTTANDGTTNYFDHSTISGFTDADCADCHDKNASTMISPFMHNVSLNNGGTDCITCHDIGGLFTNVNISEIVNGSHSGMNSEADLTGVTNGTQLCWSCHGDGSRPEEHPSNYNTPHYCDDCHTPVNATGHNAPSIVRHAAGTGDRNQINKSQLVCEDCHVNMLTVSSPAESTLAQVAHYTNNSTATGWLTCNDGCHKDVPLGAAYAGAEQTTMGGVGGVGCMYCHNYETTDNGFSNPPLGEGRNATDGTVSLHNKSIMLISTVRCDDVGICHGVPDDPRLVIKDQV
ncbi:MAG: hypothetical protein P1P69_07010 [Methanosarcinaceae archaeon]|nr:hypothetical protein [Methanosarcinaceae archaeon]